MKSILYIGGFEMPDCNAAAQRVLSIAKALRLSGYSIFFYGITKIGDIKGIIDGFEYEALPYPKSRIEWLLYATGVGITEYIRGKKPDYVITYNYPAIAQERVIHFCHKNEITVIGDITEWYMQTDVFRRVDTAIRMRWSNKHLDGIIAISKYLNDFYRSCKTIQIPPLVDIEDPKWKQQLNSIWPDRIKLIYAGSPGLSKDRLDLIVRGLKLVPSDSFVFNVVGITKEQFIELYGLHFDISELPVVFHGRLSHYESIRLLMESDFQIFFRPDLRVNNAGFPTKYVEAMTAGVPVITNRISNVDEYLTDGINGIMIEHIQEDEIQEALWRVSKLSRDVIEQMKSNCRRSIFDYHRYSGALGSFLNSIHRI